jgi:tRNA-splicing ligase RtcB (3'-phosphate/5'-hydroxy nucleic acid ligase)
MSGYEQIEGHGAPIKAWVKGVPVEPEAEQQLRNIAILPFIHSHIAVMPDVHLGKGATVGSVIPTKGAIIPAAVGVDIGCGMSAVRTSLTANDLPDSLSRIRGGIERTIPHGNGPGGNHRETPNAVASAYRDADLDDRYRAIVARHPKASAKSQAAQLGTLGGGNHFIELCLDEADRVWVMLHSRNELARRELGYHVPDKDLAFFMEGEPLFDDYVEAVAWAQDYAQVNRDVMMDRVLKELRQHLPKFKLDKSAVTCHHNYVARERHFGADVWVTRKGAVRAGEGELGIIPGSMGAKSFIVRGKGNEDSFCTCSHGAGRAMSRTAAKQRFTLADHRAATEGIECRKDAGVIDETPMAYKDIDAVMAAQSDLVDVVHTLRQIVCVKG